MCSSDLSLECELQGNVLRIATLDTLRAEAEARKAQQDAQALQIPRQTFTWYLSYAHAKDGSDWRACYDGHLEGRPSLELNGCKDRGRVGNAEVWSCPAPLAANEVRQ